LIRSNPHLEHLLFCPPCLRVADGVLESPFNVPNYHFWLVRQVVDDQTIHFIGDEGNRQITVRFLDTFQITSMLCNNRTFPMGLPSSSEESPRCSICSTSSSSICICSTILEILSPLSA